VRRAILISTLLLLLILIIGSAAAYEYRMPVNIQPTITPAVLMPGDEAVLAIELQNGAAAYGAGGTAGAGTPAAGTVLSTPINETTLKGTDEIQVTSSDYKDLGMIGPNDKITIYYKIKALDNVSSGTYLLDFGVRGGYDMININREIPVKVDSAAVSVTRADVPTKPSINLNVANPRENTLNAVTVVPFAEGVRFSPEEYYIGTMDPDEVFTISFGIDSGNPMKPVKGPVNLSFVSKFKNGDTWHESAAYVTSYMPPVDRSNQGSYLLLVGIAAAIIVLAGGFYLYRRRRNSNKQIPGQAGAK
jgi:LPXTG-motif cell wall-anchored protein